MDASATRYGRGLDQFRQVLRLDGEGLGVGIPGRFFGGCSHRSFQQLLLTADPHLERHLAVLGYALLVAHRHRFSRPQGFQHRSLSRLQGGQGFDRHRRDRVLGGVGGRSGQEEVVG